jgi:DDE superfamily endonuclease
MKNDLFLSGFDDDDDDDYIDVNDEYDNTAIHYESKNEDNDYSTLLCVIHFQKTIISIVKDPLHSTSVTRNVSVFDQRLLWDQFVSRYGGTKDLKRQLRMKVSSFAKIVTWISKDLDVDNDMASLRGGSISPEICLYLTIRFLSGASYLDVRFFTEISTASFYRFLWRTILAIRKCQFLAINFPYTAEEVKIAAKGFTSISSNSAIYTCVAVVDGYNLQIITPPKKEAKNVRSFFSGHYQTSGFNIQAACDLNCRFVFLGVAGPGNLGDREAVNAVPLGDMIESLPGLFCVIGDCAYTPTEHFVAIFRGENAQLPINDNFNFYASQLRIRIEMAFGLMVKKWGILHRPLSIKLRNVSKLIVVIGQLHNFCINAKSHSD